MPPIVVIGAGPAGSAAAAMLARAGREVVIIEARSFPRVKVCGEFISPGASALLESLLPVEALVRAGARRIEELVLELGQRSAGWPLPAPAWTLSRASLDSLLLDEARRAGAKVVQPARVTRIEYPEGRGPLGVHTSATGVLAASVIILADGSGRLDRAGAVRSRRGVVALKCHLAPGAPLRGIRMRSTPGAYIGTVQVQGGLATCALVTRSTRLADACGESHTDSPASALDRGADALLARLAPAFNPAQRVTPWLACAVPASGYIEPGHPRVFRIGNAAAAVEPVGGEGIGLALWSGMAIARMLTGLVDNALADHLPQLQGTFARSYRTRLRTRIPACRAAAEVLVRPGLARVLWPMLAAPSLMLAPWYRLTGKPSARRTADAAELPA